VGGGVRALRLDLSVPSRASSAGGLLEGADRDVLIGGLRTRATPSFIAVSHAVFFSAALAHPPFRPPFVINHGPPWAFLHVESSRQQVTHLSPRLTWGVPSLHVGGPR